MMTPELIAFYKKIEREDGGPGSGPRPGYSRGGGSKSESSKSGSGRQRQNPNPQKYAKKTKEQLVKMLSKEGKNVPEIEKELADRKTGLSKEPGESDADTEARREKWEDEVAKEWASNNSVEKAPDWVKERLKEKDEIDSKRKDEIDGIRHDFASDSFSPGTQSKTFIAKVARVGDHFYEANSRGRGSPAGTERRDAAELRKIVSQLVGKPVTMSHPPGLIANGARADVVGKVVKSWIDGDFAVAEFRVDEIHALSAIKSGVRELSLGYSTDADSNGFQRNTRVDHLALVHRARCGSACSIRVDCACSRHDKTTKEDKNVMSFYNQLLATQKGA